MLIIYQRLFRWPAGTISIAALCAQPLQAFPSATLHSIHCDVDEQGVLIPATGAAVVMSQRMREKLTAVSEKKFNCELRMVTDRSLMATYSSLFVSNTSACTPTVGASAARVRLNLTLGVDSDGLSNWLDYLAGT